MTIIQNSVQIGKSVQEVYQFLQDLNNHEQLMPENIVDWTSSADEASFTIKNMAKLSLKISQRVENRELVSIPTVKAPFDLTLRWLLDSIDDDTTKATFVIEAELNMMMKMLAAGPLQKLADHQVAKLKEILG